MVDRVQVSCGVSLSNRFLLTRGIHMYNDVTWESGHIICEYPIDARMMGSTSTVQLKSPCILLVRI